MPLYLSKQAFFPIPGMLLLGRLLGVVGVVSARPVSDGLAFLLAVIMLVVELHSLGGKKAPSMYQPGNTSTEKQEQTFKKHIDSEHIFWYIIFKETNKRFKKGRKVRAVK